MVVCVKAVNDVLLDPIKDRRGAYKKGYPLYAQPDGWTGAGDEGRLPGWVRIEVDGEPVGIHNDKLEKAWERALGYEILVHQLPTDGYRFKVYGSSASVTTQGVDGGKITRIMVENYLNNWNATVFSTASNEVVFDMGIFNAIQSEGFWGVSNVGALVDFSELAYDEDTGVHQVQAVYPVGWPRKKVEDSIISNGGVIISHIGNTIIFDVERNDILSDLKASIKDKVDIRLYRRQYYFDTSDVDIAIAAGGVVGLTLTQFNNKLKSKLDD